MLATPIARRALSALRPRCMSSIQLDLSGKFETHMLDPVPTDVTVTKEECLEYYELMYKMRRMEITCDQEYKSKSIRGFCHLYDGQEAIAIGCIRGITIDDSLITSYRCHAHQLARGDSLERIFAELFGRANGCMGGKGGSMHLYNEEGNFYGGAAIVGAQIPIGVGLAFYHKYAHKGDGPMNVGVGMLGDGAANQGQVWEAANMAQLWKLPAIIVVENNQYGMGTSSERSSANTDYYKQGGVAIPGIKCDGMDVFATTQAFKYAKEYAGGGNGPVFMELNTYRYHGHSMSDPGITYRDREEVQGVRKTRDPIDYVKSIILENSFATEAEVKDTEKAIRKEVAEACKQAKASPLPTEEQLYTDILSDGKGGSEVPEFVRMPIYEQSLGHNGGN